MSWEMGHSYAVVFGYFKFSTVIEVYMTSYASFSIVRLSVLAFDDCRGLDFVFFFLI